jgi:hypothetical protein
MRTILHVDKREILSPVLQMPDREFEAGGGSGGEGNGDCRNRRRATEKTEKKYLTEKNDFCILLACKRHFDSMTICIVKRKRKRRGGE